VVANYRATVDSKAALFERFSGLMEHGRWTLGEAAILLAGYEHPALDVDGTLQELDALSATVKTPTLNGLVSTLFGDGGFTGNTSDYYDPDNSYLHRVLQRRLGIPISLAVVAIEVGHRCGVPLSGVGFPGHFLLRDKVDPTVFIDPFGGGKYLTEAECVVWFHRQHPAGAAWNRNFLEPVDDVTILTRMISNLLAVYQRRRDLAGVQWLMKLRCALPNATAADEADFARFMSPLN
jgi:regulator of sirC expression with transglutaminase-like and TPR domain